MSILVLTSDTLIGTAAAGNIEYNGQFFGTDSNASRAQLQRIVRATAVASTSGTSIDFTGIPAWCKKITVMFNGVSTSGTSYVIVQLGDAGGVETTSYIGNSQQGGSPVAFSTGFLISTSAAAAAVRYGAVSITLINSNTWVVQGVIAETNNNWTTPLAGSKALSDTLTQVRITTVNGTDTFDAGSVNIIYEG